ncbi:hypothetical protein DW046_12105 [Bacteroides stercoris]|nr:hypothetical protein DW046_12105 [Bacteroides stercoris]
MVDIKDISGKTRFSTPINAGAKGRFTLMKEDYIILPFSVPDPVYFKLGDYVDLSGVLDESLGGLLSKVYEIVDLQKPAFNASTGGYDYSCAWTRITGSGRTRFSSTLPNMPAMRLHGL